MKKPTAIKPSSRRGRKRVVAPARRRDASVMSRRAMLVVAGGTATGGFLGRHWLGHLLSQPDAIGTAGLPRPMEEAPLPRDVHVAVAQTRPPRPPVATRAMPVAKVPPAHITEASLEVPPPARLWRSPLVPPRPAEPKHREAVWLRHARPFIDTGNVPAVAIVVDDLGLSYIYSRRAMALPENVTTAIMTYAPRPAEWVARARAARHEILVHVPMQPINPRIDPGPRALTVSLSDAQILDRLRWGLGRLDGYVGVNNHMGSRFTQDHPGMKVVMEEVKSRGLLFLDSVTIAGTVGAATAHSLHVPCAERNVFLDDEPTIPYVSGQLRVLERFARRHGSAIAIGHPHAATLAVLADWVPHAAARGIAVVPLTSVLRREAARA
ncbi:MAG: divergent polysaccharide deacetylase family protein [Stellaceae bacterium]